MQRIKGKKNSRLGVAFASVIVATVALLGVLSASLPNPPLTFQSPTATHTGIVGASYTGVYHYVNAQPLCALTFPPCLVGSEVVWYLTTPNETIRLIFYCGVGYCWNAQQISFKDGDMIHVEGTLLRPSDWPTNRYQPPLQFFGDLYVFNYTIA